VEVGAPALTLALLRLESRTGADEFSSRGETSGDSRKPVDSEQSDVIRRRPAAPPVGRQKQKTFGVARTGEHYDVS
jgi:hypothetical protein